MLCRRASSTISGIVQLTRGYLPLKHSDVGESRKLPFNRLGVITAQTNNASVEDIVRNITATSYLMMAGCILFVIQCLVFGYLPIALMLLFAAVAFFPTIWLAKRHAASAGYVCLGLSAAVIFFNAGVVFTGNNGISLMFVVLVPMSFIVLPNQPRYQHLIVAVSASLLCLISELHLLNAGYLPIPTEYQFISYLIVLSAIVVTLYWSVTIFNQSIEAHQARLTRLGQRDELTGLANRRSFISHAETVAKAPTHAWILMLDLDHFKSVNDTYGHGVGDKALLMVANAVRINLTENAFLARLGGEEFAIVLSDCNQSTALEFAEQIRHLVALEAVDPTDHPTLRCTTSIGIAPLNDNVSASLKFADEALYRAKEQGRNRTVVHSSAVLNSNEDHL